ncbi:MAG: hypothetical protein AAGM67_18715 [Bacteroidota bacterium]
MKKLLSCLTAEDLCRLIIMMNEGGRVNNRTILSPNNHHALVNQAIGLNRWEGVRATADYIGHGGTNSGFRSLMLAFPSLNTGLVVMSNGDGIDGRFRRDIAQAIVDAYAW